MKRPVVGILGGGQLALMLAESVIALGADVAIYDPDPDAPARRRYARGASRPYEDHASLRLFLDGCDVVTYEFENVPASAIRMAGSPVKILPSLDVLESCQQRGREKRAIRDAGAPTVAYMDVADRDALPAALEMFGAPAIVKTASGGYDGKGQAFVKKLGALDPKMFPPRAQLVIEEPIAIEREVSCIVACDGKHAVSLPLFENQHTAHILDVTLCPAALSPAAGKQVRAVAEKIAQKLRVVGLLTVEMFLGRGRKGHGIALPGTKSRLYVNELAPRPHNSGHVSRIACDRSQFDLLAQILLGHKITAPALTTNGVAFMANLIGDRWPAPNKESAAFGEVLADEHVRELYCYGKLEPRPGRKMGHASGVAKSRADALRIAARVRKRAGLTGPVEK